MLRDDTKTLRDIIKNATRLLRDIYTTRLSRSAYTHIHYEICNEIYTISYIHYEIIQELVYTLRDTCIHFEIYAYEKCTHIVTHKYTSTYILLCIYITRFASSCITCYNTNKSSQDSKPCMTTTPSLYGIMNILATIF